MSFSSPGQGHSPWLASTPAKDWPIDYLLRSGARSVPVALVPTDVGSIPMKNPKAIQVELRKATSHPQEITEVRQFGRGGILCCSADQECIRELLECSEFAAHPTWPYTAALGVPEVTYFMISTRNFSRNTRDHVAAIDEMMKFFARTLQCLSIFRKIRLKVTAVGNLDLLPIVMREKIAQTEIGSDDESPAAKLRLCVAYNTKVGLKNMVLDLVKAVQAGAIESDDITAGFLADWLAVSEAPETELWFRSSGEMRFSEFLVLQSGYSYIHIDPQLWPAITSWNWIWADLQFQLKWPYIKAFKDSHRNLWASPQDRNGCASIIRQNSFLSRIKCAKMAYLSSQCFSEINQPTNASLLFSGNHLTE